MSEKKSKLPAWVYPVGITLLVIIIIVFILVGTNVIKLGSNSSNSIQSNQTCPKTECPKTECPKTECPVCPKDPPKPKTVKLGITISENNLSKWSKFGVSKMKFLSSLLHEVIDTLRVRMCTNNDNGLNIRKEITQIINKLSQAREIKNQLSVDLTTLLDKSICYGDTVKSQGDGVFFGLIVKRDKMTDKIQDVLKFVSKYIDTKFLFRHTLTGGSDFYRGLERLLKNEDYNDMVKRKDRGIEVFQKLLGSKPLATKIVNFQLKLKEDDSKLLRAFMNDLDNNIDTLELTIE